MPDVSNKNQEETESQKPEEDDTPPPEEERLSVKSAPRGGRKAKKGARGRVDGSGVEGGAFFNGVVADSVFERLLAVGVDLREFQIFSQKTFEVALAEESPLLYRHCLWHTLSHYFDQRTILQNLSIELFTGRARVRNLQKIAEGLRVQVRLTKFTSGGNYNLKTYKPRTTDQPCAEIMIGVIRGHFFVNREITGFRGGHPANIKKVLVSTVKIGTPEFEQVCCGDPNWKSYTKRVGVPTITTINLIHRLERLGFIHPIPGKYLFFDPRPARPDPVITGCLSTIPGGGSTSSTFSGVSGESAEATTATPPSVTGSDSGAAESSPVDAVYYMLTVASAERGSSSGGSVNIKTAIGGGGGQRRSIHSCCALSRGGAEVYEATFNDSGPDQLSPIYNVLNKIRKEAVGRKPASRILVYTPLSMNADAVIPFLQKVETFDGPMGGSALTGGFGVGGHECSFVFHDTCGFFPQNKYGLVGTDGGAFPLERYDCQTLWANPSDDWVPADFKGQTPFASMMQYAVRRCEAACRALQSDLDELRRRGLEFARIDLDSVLSSPALAHQYMISQGCFDGVVPVGQEVLAYVQGGAESFGPDDDPSVVVDALSAVKGYPVGEPVPFYGEPLDDENFYVATVLLKEIQGGWPEAPPSRPLASSAASTDVVEKGGVEAACRSTKRRPGVYYVLNSEQVRLARLYEDAVFEFVGGLVWPKGWNPLAGEVLRRLRRLCAEKRAEGDPLHSFVGLLLNNCYTKLAVPPCKERIRWIQDKNEVEVWISALDQGNGLVALEEFAATPPGGMGGKWKLLYQVWGWSHVNYAHCGGVLAAKMEEMRGLRPL
jgi:hypothetical protein